MVDHEEDKSRYTFGDQGPAAERLRRLSNLYRPVSEAALQRARDGCGSHIGLAIDLGAGPGYTTELVAEVTGADRTIGYERSALFCEEARRRLPAEIEFVEQDVAAFDLPVKGVDLAFCRFLLTHLPDPVVTLKRWIGSLRPGGMLVLVELEKLSSSDPTLARYYEIIDGVQAQHGQQMYIGDSLEGFARDAGFAIFDSRRVEPAISAAGMATLHRPNLDNVRQHSWVKENFSDHEIDEVAAGLERIAQEVVGRTPIQNVLRIVVAQREGQT